MPPKSRKKQPKRGLSLDEFCNGLAEKNNELLEGFIYGIQNKELGLELEHGDEFMNATIDEWCQTEEPNRALHLRMISCIFIWMLLDELYSEEIEGEFEPEPPIKVHVREEHGNQAAINGMINDKAMIITVEVLRTVRAIWGLNNGK